MDNHNIIVAFIILSAILYIGLLLFKKLKSFTTKGSCGAGCGCAGSQKNKIAKI